jgi:predicted TPR repeat methyltransferase
MLNYLKQAGFTNLAGIDISADQAAEAVARGFNAVEADALQFLPQHKAEYDVIVAMDVIEHFRKEELLELLGATRDALKPGGLFLLQTPNGEGLMPGYVIYGDLTHFTILSPLSLRHVLTVAGFDDIHMKELGPGAFVHFPLFVGWQVVRAVAVVVKFLEIGRIQRYWTESFICWCRKP